MLDGTRLRVVDAVARHDGEPPDPPATAALAALAEAATSATSSAVTSSVQSLPRSAEARSS